MTNWMGWQLEQWKQYNGHSSVVYVVQTEIIAINNYYIVLMFYLRQWLLLILIGYFKIKWELMKYFWRGLSQWNPNLISLPWQCEQQWRYHYLLSVLIFTKASYCIIKNLDVMPHTTFNLYSYLARSEWCQNIAHYHLSITHCSWYSWITFSST